jgi:hypothetical protein
MNEAFEEKGVWQISSPEGVGDEQYFGTLSWAPHGGATLVIDGLTMDQCLRISASQCSRFLIHGQLNSIPQITIGNAVCTSITPSLAARGSVKFEAYEISRGDVRLPDFETTPLYWIGCEMSGLKDLVGGTLIQADIDEESRNYKVTCKNRTSDLFARVDGIEISIGQFCSSKRSGGTFSATDRYAVELKGSPTLTHKAAISLLGELKDFFTLALDKPVVFEKINVSLNDPAEGSGSRSVQLFRKVTKADADAAREKTQPSIFPFSLRPYGISGAAFEKFHQIRKSIRMAIDFFFSGYYGADAFINQKFADIVHGLEGLHRGLRGGTFSDQVNYEAVILPQIVSSIPVGIDPSLRAALKKRLEYGNEFSLRRRLKDLARFHDDYAKPIIGNPCKFADSVADLRNELAHATSNQEPSAEMVEKYFLQFHRCRVLFQLELFYQLGFDSDFLAGSITRLRSARFLLERTTATDVS